jgi:proton-dependent oligopeptide transporter, POT family
VEQTIVQDRKQPKAIFFLFTIEMWERFSYYGMRAIMVFFMMQVLMLDVRQSGRIYGWYTGLTYLTPLVGGYIADRYFGARKCIWIGALLMAIGQFALMISGFGTPSTHAFYIGLVILVVGSGFFKPNISTVVGGMYKKNDPRRDGGFTIFYMGINVGAAIAPLICGWLGERIGWQYGFMSAGIGMTLGLLMYLWGQKKFLGDTGIYPAVHSSNIHSEDNKRPLTKEEKHRVAVIFILVFFCIFFWSAFEQAGTSLNLFALNSTNRVIFGWEMPASFFQSLNPIFIVLLAPLFSKMWISLAERNKEPSLPAKFVWGLVLLGIGFVIMVAAAQVISQTGAKVGILWLTFVYLFHTLGELCLSPVGLSAVTKLAPAKFASLLMATWFLSSFVANLSAGFFAGEYDSVNHVRFFILPVATAFGSAILLFFLRKKIVEWMHGVQ